MNPIIIAISVAAIIFAGGAVGLALQRRLHESHTTGGAGDMIRAVVALLTLLAALVSGLLISTAYGVYSTQNAAIQTYGARALQFDLALADYGPDATPGRGTLRLDLQRTIDQMWGERSEGDFVTRNYEAAIENLHTRQAYLDTLHPSTDEQKAALATARQAVDSLFQLRLQMSLALTNPLSYELLAVVVLSAFFLFCGLGLGSRMGFMTFAALAVGALAISSAVYLILDLSDPYSGLFRASPASIERVISKLQQCATGWCGAAAACDIR